MSHDRISSLRLVGPRLLVERLAVGEQTRTGLWLPSVARELPSIGTVRAVGEYKPVWFGSNGNEPLVSRRALDAKVGQLVIFPKYHDRTIVIDGVELLDLRHDEVLAILEED